MALFYVIFLLLFGTLNTLTTKWQFSMQSPGIDGIPKNFQKPWWGNFAMFAAMIVVIVVYFVDEVKRRKGPQPDIESGSGKSPIGIPVGDGDRMSTVTILEEKLLSDDDKDSDIKKKDKKNGKKSPISSVFSDFFTRQKFNEFCSVGLPAVLDLVASGLNFMGLLCISASVWQMLRGSMIVFSALLSILFLNRQMAPFHWLGIFLCVCGITCVGSASVLGDAATAAQERANDPNQQNLSQDQLIEQAKQDADASYKTTIGLILVMVAQVIQAGQCVAEERLLKNLSIPGTLVVAFEGVWGCLIMMLIVFPLLDYLPGSDVGGVQENTLDTLTMIGNSFGLQVMLGIYLISCSTYNIARMLVTSNMSAIHFTMIDCSRTALVWCIDLLLMYQAPQSYHQFGEKWTDYSYLQAIGFLILIFGQCIYGGVLTFPIARKFFYPDLNEEEIQTLKYSRIASNRYMATPLPPYSIPGNNFNNQGGPGAFNNKKCQKLSDKEDLNPFISMGKDNAFLAEGSVMAKAGA